nr:EOG090X0APE [Polyphemus pediculus]
MSLNLLGSLARNASRFLPVYTRSHGIVSKPLARSLWSTSLPTSSISPKKLLSGVNHASPFCPCGACAKYSQSSGEKELVNFLVEEIEEEKKLKKTIPTSIDGFEVKSNGAKLILTKKTGDETIKIELNINLSVDADAPTQDDTPDILNSKPPFEVNVIKGNQTVMIGCSFVMEEVTAESPDFYYIEDLTVFEGTHTDEVYTVSADILDGVMYDLLMNYLEEKGVTNAFAEKLCELATNYEQGQYITMLEKLKSFIPK